ncbi:hypothetical protein [Kribbella antiqua]|uniref:hypothetical protein n=1 Tax=Kribbella antiqua TaxID=2512217 RepID=UPI001305265D|nr:hypothetical protein [Kribbella antiqua]
MRRRIKVLGAAAALTIVAPLVLVSGSAASAAVTTATCNGMASPARLDAVSYADRLVRAWGRGDRPATDCYASAATARTLFGQATPGGIHWRRVSAEGAAGTIYVTYHDDARGGNLTIGVQNVGLRESDGWHAAYTARFQEEPRAWGPVAWSDNLVRAWGRGDKTWMSYYATPAVVSSLTHISPTGGPSWRRVAAEGAAGTTYVTYHNDANGHQLVLGISNVGLSQGDAHAAYRIQYR